MEENEPTNNKRSKPDLLRLQNKRVKSEDLRNKRGSIMSGAKQLATIEKVKQGYEGSDYYLLSKDWYISWESYCLGLRTAPPDSIDNSSLLLENKEIRPDLRQEEYFILPFPALRCLRIW
jgi:hypothetical protein